MTFENTEEVRKIFTNVNDVVNSINTEEKRLKDELRIRQAMQQDLLHEVELVKLNAIERVKIIDDIKKVREERRQIKDQLGRLELLKSFCKRYIEKGMLSETRQAIKNLDTYDKSLKNRVYRPRILKDLKCAAIKGDHEFQEETEEE